LAGGVERAFVCDFLYFFVAFSGMKRSTGLGERWLWLRVVERLGEGSVVRAVMYVGEILAVAARARVRRFRDSAIDSGERKRTAAVNTRADERGGGDVVFQAEKLLLRAFFATITGDSDGSSRDLAGARAWRCRSVC
jgi:hypothetical protein